MRLLIYSIRYQGRDFLDIKYNCSFGGVLIAAKVINGQMIQCIAPSNKNDGNVSFKLIIDKLIVSYPSHQFLYLNIDILSIYPTSGPISGGSLVVITLSNPSAHITHCRFKDSIVKALPSTTDDDQIICKSPKQKIPGRVSLELSLDGVDYIPSNIQFLYTMQPIVDHIYPASGSSTGGTTVILTGYNFVETNEIRCRFGKHVCRGNWISNNTMTCMSPSTDPGEIKLEISNNGVDFVHTNFNFTFHKSITALSFYPLFGIRGGGTVVQLLGTNFEFNGALKCLFGHIETEATFVNSNEVICISPVFNRASSVNVSISLNGLDFVSFPDRFTFYTPFEISSLSPSSGEVFKSTAVKVNGLNFQTNSSEIYCNFGKEAKRATIISESLLICNAPERSITTKVEFSLSFYKDTYHSNLMFSYFRKIRSLSTATECLDDQCDAMFTLEKKVTATSFTPQSGPRFGNTKVHLYGTNFPPSSILKCLFDEIEVDATFVNRNELVCLTPVFNRAVSVNVSVVVNGTNVVYFSDYFTFKNKAAENHVGSGKISF